MSEESSSDKERQLANAAQDSTESKNSPSGMLEGATADKPAKTEDQVTETKESPTETTKQTKRRRLINRVVDGSLLLAALAMLGGGAYYLKLQLDKYHVPSPMEEAIAEQAALQKEYQAALQELESRKAEALNAYEQLRMRRRLADLDQQIKGINDGLQKVEGEIQEQQQRIFALQHEIRQEDRSSRSVARHLLPGITLNNVSTSNGKTFMTATIYRVENNGTLVLRIPSGQVMVKARQIDMQNMPDILSYAFDQLDLVDMSDFETAESAKKPNDEATRKKSSAKKAAAKQASKRKLSKGQISFNYEPESSDPVLDTSCRYTINSSSDEDEAPRSNGPVWQAPSGELPM